MDKLSSQDFLTYLNKVIKDFESEKVNGNTNDRSLGVIYTPKIIVDYIISNVFKLYFEEFFNFPKTSNKKSIFEFSQQILSKNHSLKSEFISKLKNIINSIKNQY